MSASRESSLAIPAPGDGVSTVSSGNAKWVKALGGVRRGISKITMILLVLYAVLSIISIVTRTVDYREFPLIGSRVVVWSLAQGHLMFAAFVLGVPIFVLITEIIGAVTKSEQYDRLAKEFTRLLAMSYTLTALSGGLLLVALVVLYPRVMVHMRKVFDLTWTPYVACIFFEALFAYAYWYTWDLLKNRKGWHIFIGVMVNVLGIGLLVITNAWTAYMMTPGGVEGRGALIEVTSRTSAFFNFAWNPLNIHRVLANVCFGGIVCGAYAAFRFLGAKSDEERAHYDWMGYVGSFIAVAAFILLPFAGYYLGRELYAYSQQMGISMMGGSFAQLWIMQAVLIGSLFLAINLYLWLAMGRIPGGERYRKYQWLVLAAVGTGFAVWATPHTIIATVVEQRAMGGAYHPKIGVLGVMSAKMTAVHMMILATFMNFMFYRRGNKQVTSRWAIPGKLLQTIGLLATAGAIVGIGIYGYFIPAQVRVNLSVWQPIACTAFFLLFLILEIPIYRGSKSLGEIRWGKMPPRSQYVLIFLAISFTWLMALMGYIRSGVRQYWHVYQVMQDTSADAFTPTHGFATIVISLIVLGFFLFVAMVFAMAMRSEAKEKAA